MPGAGAAFTPPADLGELNSVNGFVYASRYPVDGKNSQAITSTDRGKTWQYFEPR
ncbi:hypothetical protein GCM10009789_08470 [Kribbella sancticallisti]|uniref:Uncharacterized protein n=1 Tax=Kribbella sancticallisti TaxID=460087 RepID=A0ABN2CFV6_9ACTN